MKSQIKRFSKSALAVVLTLCMVISCMTVGIIATDAAKVLSESVGENATPIYLLLSGTHSTVKINIHKGTGNDDPWFTDSMTDTGKTYNSNKIYSATVNDEWNGLGKFEFNVDGTYKDVFGDGDIWHNDTSVWRGRMYDWDNSAWMDYAEDSQAADVTFYVCNSDNWNTVCAYLYGGTIGNSASWPGTTLSPTSSTYYVGTYKGSPVYKATVNTNCANILVNNNDNLQYGDNIALVNNKLYYSTNTNKTTNIGSVENFSNSKLDKTVTVSAGTNGKFSDNSTANKTVAANASGTYAGTLPTVVAPDGYEFDSWTTSSSGITINNADKNDGTATVNATANGTVKATYKVSTVTYYLGYRVEDTAESENKSATFTDGSATVNLTAGKTYEFWISSSKSEWFKNPDKGTMVRDNCSNWTFTNNSQANTKITADETGSYTFSFTKSGDDLKVSVAYPEKQKKITTIYVNSDSGATNVYLFKNDSKLRGQSDWPGEALSSTTETINGYTYKKIEFDSTESDFQFIVNKNGSPQTNDSALQSTGGTYYVIWDGSGKNFDLSTTAPTKDNNNYSITFKNEAGWNDVKVYMFGDGGAENDAWPGKDITVYGHRDEGAGLYRLTVPKTYTSIIFNNGDDKQTADLVLEDNGAYTNGSGGSITGYTTIKAKGTGLDGLYIWTLNTSSSFYATYNQDWNTTKNNLSGQQKDNDGYYVVTIPNGDFSTSDGTFNFILRCNDDKKIENDDFKGLAVGGTYIISATDFTNQTYTFESQDGLGNIYFFGGSEQNPNNHKRLVGETSQSGNTYTIKLDTTNYTSGTSYYVALCKSKSNVDQWFKGDASGVTVVNNSEDLITAGVSEWNFPNGASSIAAKYLTFKFSDDADVTSVTITCNTDTKTYTISATGSVSDSIYVYAKDGMLRYPYDGGATYYQTFANWATTTITSHESTSVVDSVSNQHDYDYAKIEKGETLTIETQVDNAHKDSIYVKGFCVNGVTYELYDYNSSGLYSTTIILNDDINYVKGKYLEITPIYYYKDVETVRFYVSGYDEEVKKSWGNTIAAYPFYEGINNGANIYGGYPGQPMIFYGGEYFLDIPLKTGDAVVKGITMSNFYWDRIHGTTSDENKIYNIGAVTGHNQTYDYDDFYMIYNEVKNDQNKSPEFITYHFKYETTKDNEEEKSGFNPANYEGSSGNGWEYLVDGSNEKTDILNNVLADQSATANPLYVVSDGYWNLYSGYYSTKWYVYDNGSLVATISPSVRFMKNAASFDKSDYAVKAGDPSVSDFKAAFNTLNTSTYLGRPVLITYEKEIRNDGTIHDSGTQPAKRSDGLWTYTFADTAINANILVEISTDHGATYPTDNPTAQTLYGSKYKTEQGLSAYFTNNNFYGKIESGDVQSSASDMFTFTAETAGNYIFAGWWLKTADGKYQPITKASDGESSMATSSTFVARFYEAPAGTLTVNHLLSSDSESGLADLYVSVSVNKKGDGNATYYTKKLSSIGGININKETDSTVKITLYTVTKGSGQYKKFSVPQSTNFDNITYIDDTDTGKVNQSTTMADPATATFTYSVDDLFSGDTLKHNVLNLYSSVGIADIPYLIEYTVQTRLYGQRLFRVEGNLTSYEIHKYFKTEFETYSTVNALTNQFVIDKAPRESNYRYTTAFDSEKIALGVNSVASAKKDGKLYASLVADNDPVTTVTATFTAEGLNQAPITVAYGALFIKKDGSYVTALSEIQDPAYPTDATKKLPFSYWSIKSHKTNAEVARCYNVKFLYSGYEDYDAEAVYGQGTAQDNFNAAKNTTINLLDTTRNHWNDTVDGQLIAGDGKWGYANTEYDRLYIDFAIAFNYNDVLLKDTNNEVGIELKKASDEWGSDGVTTVKINNNKIDNKNRLEYYIGISNAESNRTTWNARSYMVIDGQKIYSDAVATFDLTELGYAESMYSSN